jgi:integrase
LAQPASSLPKTFLDRCAGIRGFEAASLAMRGATAKSIQELAGHQHLSTTERYMHLSPAARESAMRLLDAPVANPGDGLETGATEAPQQ